MEVCYGILHLLCMCLHGCGCFNNEFAVGTGHISLWTCFDYLLSTTACCFGGPHCYDAYSFQVWRDFCVDTQHSGLHHIRCHICRHSSLCCKTKCIHTYTQLVIGVVGIGHFCLFHFEIFLDKHHIGRHFAPRIVAGLVCVCFSRAAVSAKIGFVFESCYQRKNFFYARRCLIVLLAVTHQTMHGNVQIVAHLQSCSFF